MGYRNPRAGCWLIVHLREDNIRFILLAIVMVIYMLFGAALFMGLERGNELKEKEEYYAMLNNFTQENPGVDKAKLEKLLKTYAEIGHTTDKRPRWDYAGAFYFVGTVVSTIGFGMTTPRTIPGKICLILYGFFGCAGAILFFNLFLERIITFLAYILRSLHERELRRKGLLAPRDGRRGSQSSQESLDDWKPSVYWVMLILFLSAIVIACCASAMYFPVEDITYFDAFYFCFVAFATIGFGDYIVSQHDEYDNANAHMYRLGNFIFIVMGCCCVYSLFNVTSIVIKQFLNWLIRRMDCRCCYKKKPVVRRNAITPGSNLSKSRSRSLDLAEIDSTYDSDPERRGSGEMISMTDFLKSNKITLAMMQKQLHDSANRQHTSQQNGSSGFQGGVGPLAILNKKLGQDEV